MAFEEELFNGAQMFSTGKKMSYGYTETSTSTSTGTLSYPWSEGSIVHASDLNRAFGEQRQLQDYSIEELLTAILNKQKATKAR